MITYVLAVEATTYEDVLVRRIARSHGIHRVGHFVREANLDRIDPQVARTDDDGRTVLRQIETESNVSWPYRSADGIARGQVDTPMPDLVGLATTLPSWISEAEQVRHVSGETRSVSLPRSGRTSGGRWTLFTTRCSTDAGCGP